MKLVKILTWLAVTITALWTILAPDFEPVAAFITSLIAAITIQVKSHHHYNEITAKNRTEPNNVTPSKNIEKEIPKSNPVFQLANRFIEVFESHGIHLNEIPRCIPQEYEIS